MYTLGIDIGSTTVKVVILDEENNMLFSAYERHYANIIETLGMLVEQAYEKLGNITGETIGEDLVNEIFSKFCMGK